MNSAEKWSEVERAGLWIRVIGELLLFLGLMNQAGEKLTLLKEEAMIRKSLEKAAVMFQDPSIQNTIPGSWKQGWDPYLLVGGIALLLGFLLMVWTVWKGRRTSSDKALKKKGVRWIFLPIPLLLLSLREEMGKEVPEGVWHGIRLLYLAGWGVMAIGGVLGLGVIVGSAEAWGTLFKWWTDHLLILIFLGGMVSLPVYILRRLIKKRRLAMG